MGTKKKDAKLKLSALPPLDIKPVWWDALKARSFAEGVKEAERYIKNAEANAKKAKTHPIDADRFLDVKYSSAAGQFGYLAAMILVDGFIASCPLSAINFAPDPQSFQPSNKYPSIPEAEKINRQTFMTKGPNNQELYFRFLNLAFTERIAELFKLVHAQLHIMVHYQHSEQISDYALGLKLLTEFKAKFTEEAEKQLKAAGVEV